MGYGTKRRRKKKRSLAWAAAAIVAAVSLLLVKAGTKEKPQTDMTAAEGEILGTEWIAAEETPSREDSDSAEETLSREDSDSAEESLLSTEPGEAEEDFSQTGFDAAVGGFPETEDPEVVEAAIIEQETQRIVSLSAGELAVEGIVRAGLIDRLFYAAAVDEALLDRILGNSYTPNEMISLSELSYLRMLYYGPDENTYVGEMMVNQEIAADVLEIFRTLYENRYPIERMVLIDDYGADDEASMEANNTSAFNYRTIAGSSKLSNHSYGMAIDLNPKYNPYVKTASDGSIFCQPQGSYAYADRTKEFAYKIDEGDLAYQLFTKAGFSWGGNWESVKDYQHFEKVK